MSLRSKIVLILAGVALLYVGSDLALTRTMVTAPFERLERQEVMESMERVQVGLDVLVEEVALQAKSMARRADVAAFVTDGGEQLLEELGEGALAELQLSLLYLCRADGGVAWSRSELGGERVTVAEFPTGRIDPRHPLHIRREREGLAQSSGLLDTEHGPILVALHAIEGADGEEVGCVIAGRFFDAGVRAQLLSRVLAEVDISSVLAPLADVTPELQDRITDSAEPQIEYLSDSELFVYAKIEDVLKRPWLILRSRFDRSVTAGGKKILDFALLSTLASALVLLLVLLRLLDRIVIRPLSHLTQHAQEIGATEDMSKRVAMDRDDELGRLSGEFDRLMGRLQRSREQVIETARVAGMSEIATGILHNVGNVLNSVNVSTNLAQRKAEDLSVGDLEAMAGVLEAQEDLGRFLNEDARGKQFLPFLSELSSAMAGQQRELMDELRSLGVGVDHVIELVRKQQSYAGMHGVFEPTDLAEAVESALSICEQASPLNGELDIRRDFKSLEQVAVDKHKLMEILVNLIQNARQMMCQTAAPERVLTLRVYPEDADNVCIEVEDTGPGIADENLTRIFAHGYTTRPEGHGFGLHVSANAATEMKGSLFAASEGLGHGATFTLRLPRRSAVPAPAAA